MANQILFTPNDSGLGNDVKNKVMVGANCQGFTNKVFVIDLDMIMFPFNFYTIDKQIVSNKQLTNIGVYEADDTPIDFYDLPRDGNYIQKFLSCNNSVTVHEIIYYDHIDFVPVNYVTAYVFQYGGYPEIYFDSTETSTTIIDNKEFYEHHLKFNTPHTFDKTWNGYSVVSWIFPCYGYDKNKTNVNEEYFVHYNELIKKTHENHYIGTMWYPGVWDATRAFAYEPIIKYKITDDNHQEPVWINQ